MWLFQRLGLTAGRRGHFSEQWKRLIMNSRRWPHNEFAKVARRSTVGLLRWVLFQSGFLVRKAQQSKRSVILMFHGIPKESTEEFHDLLRSLEKHFAIVPMDTLIDRISQSGSQKSMILPLTFVDGLRNHA